MDFTYPLNWYKTREQNHKDETGAELVIHMDHILTKA